MRVKLAHWISFSALSAGWLTGMGACATTQLVPPEPPPVQPPKYVQVPHPLGTDLGDLRAVLLAPEAPSRETLKSCSSDFMKLRNLTQSDDERKQGARELVKRDPVFYHWCYYSKVLELEDVLKTSQYIDEKQKATLETYQFLVPMGRAFMAEYQDSRYLRWAITHYRKISEWVFFRRLDLTPAGTSELVQVSNPFGLWRDSTPELTVLEKYGIAVPQGDATVAGPVKTIFPEEVMPLPEPDPVASAATDTPQRAPAGNGEAPLVEPAIVKEEN